MSDPDCRELLLRPMTENHRCSIPFHTVESISMAIMKHLFFSSHREEQGIILSADIISELYFLFLFYFRML